MVRSPNPSSKSPYLTMRARNEAEEIKLKELRRIARKDNLQYMDIFLPAIDALIRADNPQLHFVATQDQLILSKQAKSKAKPEVKVTCGHCGGEGCQRCAGLGYYYENAAP
jgi:hypothetical protein